MSFIGPCVNRDSILLSGGACAAGEFERTLSPFQKMKGMCIIKPTLMDTSEGLFIYKFRSCASLGIGSRAEKHHTDMLHTTITQFIYRILLTSRTATQDIRKIV